MKLVVNLLQDPDFEASVRDAIKEVARPLAFGIIKELVEAKNLLQDTLDGYLASKPLESIIKDVLLKTKWQEFEVVRSYLKTMIKDMVRDYITKEAETQRRLSADEVRTIVRDELRHMFGRL